MSVKNSSDTIGNNRTRDLPACSAVRQRTAPPCAPYCLQRYTYFGRQVAVAAKFRTVARGSEVANWIVG